MEAAISKALPVSMTPWLVSASTAALISPSHALSSNPDDQHSRHDHGHQALAGTLCLQRGEFKVVVGKAAQAMP